MTKNNQSLGCTSPFRELIGANKHADEQASGVTPVGSLSITVAEAENTIPGMLVHSLQLKSVCGS